MTENRIQTLIKELQKEIHSLQEVTTAYDEECDALNKALTRALIDFDAEAQG